MKKDFFEISIPFIGGAVVILLAGFATGLITTSGNAALAAQAARIDARATFCQEAAVAHFAELGQPMPDFKGMDANGRKQVAQTFLTASGDVQVDRLALQSCTDKLAA